MPQTLNLVGDNKCFVNIIRGSVTSTIGDTGEVYIPFNINGNIGENGVISVCQELRSGDVVLKHIYVGYTYDEASDRTSVMLICNNEPDHGGTVKINYLVIPS